MTYDASSIRVLTAEEAKGFDWNRAYDLARDNAKHVDWILRGFEASYRLNMNTDYFEKKYIFGEDIQYMPEFSEVFQEILKENRLKES
jgi:hypothetical protein